MSTVIERYSEVAFVLLVTGAAMSPFPFLALIVAGLYFAFLAWLHDRRTAPPTEETAE